MRALMIFFVAILVIATSCKDDPNSFTPFTPVNQTASHTDTYQNAGLGEQPGTPAGTLYKLPNGISIIGFVHGNAPTVMNSPSFDKDKFPGQSPVENPEKATWISYGYGSLVNLYFSLQNDTDNDITVTIPKGTVCYEASHVPSYQHGLLVKSVNIPVPAHDTSDVHLALFCVNAHHGIANASTVYKLGIITIHPDLLTVCNILDSKSFIDPTHFGTIQSIIWKITDNGGFGQADIDALNAM